jgi:HD-GYP domain-containing protein (c-di-GMP phosphodiesterase class II)
LQLDLNNLVVALSHAIDFMEMDFLGVVSNHSKRVTYIALKIAECLALPPEARFDLVALSILHDNGIGAAFQSIAGTEDEDGAPSGAAGLRAAEQAAVHCTAGEKNIEDYPLLTGAKDIITYHHENYDGSGFFRLRGESIPLLAQIIRLADLAESGSNLRNVDYEGKTKLYEFLEQRSGRIFAPTLLAAFREAAAYPAFWLDLQDEFVGAAIHRSAPHFGARMSFAEIRGATAVFSRIIDSKSRFTRLHSQELSERAGRMGERYGMDGEAVAELRIAADLHDLGKLAVSNAILDKPGGLEPSEVDAIQRHTYYTRVSLQSIAGFENITEWAANHHEKLDGSGYPYRLEASRLDFNSRLMAGLDIYQALTEERPYREALSHGRSMEILRGLATQGKLEAGVVEDIDAVFAGD